MAEVVQGDLLTAAEEYLCQQCNCISVRPHGLSQAIANKFPHADPYSRRRSTGNRNLAIDTDRPMPGSIQVYGTASERKVICMFAQYGMGKPYAYGQATVPDSHEDRLRWFATCLDKIAALQPCSIALPWCIGCGLAGGKWESYKSIIDQWASDHPHTKVRLYRL